MKNYSSYDYERELIALSNGRRAARQKGKVMHKQYVAAQKRFQAALKALTDARKTLVESSKYPATPEIYRQAQKDVDTAETEFNTANGLLVHHAAINTAHGNVPKRTLEDIFDEDGKEL